MKSLFGRGYFVIFTPFLLVSGIIGLFGCDNEVNTDSICKNNPEICADLHKDSWCLYEKGDLIRQRFMLQSTPSPTGKMLYDQLRTLEVYSKCIELAAGVQHKINVQRTSNRLQAYGASVQNLEELQNATRGSDDPYLAYYHWARFNDMQALQVLVQAQAEGRIQDPELLSKLANYYLKTDARQAITLYLDALALAEPELAEPDWLLGIASAARSLNDMETVYMMSRANVLLSDQRIDEVQMKALIFSNASLASMLDAQAKQLAGIIRAGDFAGSELEKSLRQKWAPPAKTEPGSTKPTGNMQ